MSRYRHLRGRDAPIDEVIDTMREWGIRPLPDPPPGERYKTLAEYRQEFNGVGITAARKQEIIAVRLGLRPPETVPD